MKGCRFCILLILFGCATTAPIRNVDKAPVVTSTGKKLSMTEVASAIQRAGRAMGWQMVVEGPGLFTGRLELRTHVAVVKIEHTTETYAIRYDDSTNLDASDGQIHKAYNQWVQNLDDAIRRQFLTL